MCKCKLEILAFESLTSLLLICCGREEKGPWCIESKMVKHQCQLSLTAVAITCVLESLTLKETKEIYSVKNNFA